MTDRVPAADAALEAAVQGAVDVMVGDRGPLIVTDWVVVVAGVHPTEAGERTGYYYLPRPHQPMHSTLGLLDYGLTWARDDAISEDD